MDSEGHRIGKYIRELPRDAYGNRYRLGGKIASQKFGIGTVIGVARGCDGRICIVCNFRAAYRAAGHVTSKWRTWLVPAEEGGRHSRSGRPKCVSKRNCGSNTEKWRKRKRSDHKRYYGKTAFIYEPHQWTQAEDALVLAHVIPDSELSPLIERSMKSISNRRWRLKKRKQTPAGEIGEEGHE